jgi:hypothetical protein
VQLDLKIRGFRNWRGKTRDRDKWRAEVGEAKFHDGLSGGIIIIIIHN